MRNTIIISILIMFMSLISTDSVAQLGKTTVSFGGGQFFKKTVVENSDPIGTFGGVSVTRGTTTFAPHFTLTLERRRNKSLSIGGAFHYVTAQTTNIITNTFAGGAAFISQQNAQVKMGGISLNPKLFFYSDADFDVYAGAAFGLLMSTTTRTVSNVIGGVNQVNFFGSDGGDLRVLVDLNIGGRCFFTENLGFYGEVGFLSLYLKKSIAGQGGVIYRF